MPTFVAVTFLSFLLIHLVPGDPIETRSGERGIAPERLAELRHEFGFDQPLWRQFLHYERQVAQRRSRHLDRDAATRSGASSCSCSRRRSNCRSAPSCSPC